MNPTNEFSHAQKSNGFSSEELNEINEVEEGLNVPVNDSLSSTDKIYIKYLLNLLHPRDKTSVSSKGTKELDILDRNLK